MDTVNETHCDETHGDERHCDETHCDRLVINFSERTPFVAQLAAKQRLKVSDFVTTLCFIIVRSLQGLMCVSENDRACD